MRTIHVFDAKNYNPEWKKFSREAVRAIIRKGDKIAMVKSKREGFYKFPGGGMKNGENHLDTLIRETREETGLNIIPQTISAYGTIQELRKGVCGEEIFDHKSHYYFADAEDATTAQDLDDYEKDYEFELVWTDIKTARAANIALGKNPELYFLIREAYVLNLLLGEPT
jgi:8-oxo-dGTP pyrophosphatase MutT (NUDIX family)